MYQASKKFGDAIAGSNRKFNTRLLENEKVLVESVKNFTITSGAEEITIGSAVASYVQATIENKGIALSGKEVSLEIGVEVDGEMEYIPMGLYTIQNPKIESNKITFTAYDRLASRCNGAYYSKLSYPTDAVDILAEISTMTGVAIDTSTVQRGIQINQRAIIEEGDYNEETDESEVITTYVNPFDGYTYKETIGFIAGLFGKFAICGRTGMIEFRWYQGIDYEIPSNIFYNDLQETEESFSIKRLTCDNSDQTLSSGSGATGISMQNPVMTQSILDGVYNTVQGLVFTPAALRFIGDTRLDIGDIVTAVKNDGTKFTIPIISLITSYDGGLMQTIASYGNTAEEDDSDTKGPITEMAERVEYELAFVKKLMVDNLIATNATIKNLSGDVLKFKTGEFETLKTDVANFKQTFTDDLQASNAKINTLESDHATFKEATATNLNATNARIANIEADYLKATDAKLTYATITNLNTTNAEITKLKTKDAEIDKLVATKATITDLNAAVGRVGLLESSYANLNTLVNGNLTSDNIQNLTLTSKNTTIENGMIKNAMIENLSFDKIIGMDINTTNLTVHSSDGKSKWSDNTIQISDANRVRVQIGKDASNDYSMSVWDKNGNLIWDAIGATEKTIQRKIIRDGIVADDANISGSKLDINSVVKEVNGSTTKLKSSTIVMNDKNQTLDAVFNEMETTVADNLSSAKLYADGKLSDAQKYALEQANSALSSAKSYADSAVDNIEVGGRNLVLDSINFRYDSNFAGNARFSSIIVEDSSALSGHHTEMTCTVSGTGGAYGYPLQNDTFDSIGKTITISFYWKCNTERKLSIGIENGGTFNETVSTDWKKITKTYVPYRNYYAMVWYARESQWNVGDVLYIRDLKIEFGNKATDWTPAPEDRQSQIDNITEITTSHTTSISTMQGQISSLISEDTTIKGNYNALLSRYNATVNTVDSMKTTIGEHTTILNSQNDSIAAVTTKANTIESNLAGTTQTVSEVKSNLVGTQERVTKVETSLTGLTTRVSSTETNLANLEIGGRNLLWNSGTATAIHDSGEWNAHGCTATTETRNNCLVSRVNSEWNGYQFNLKKIIERYNLVNGDILTYSIDVKMDEPIGILFVNNYYADNKNCGGGISTVYYWDEKYFTIGKWERLSFTFKITQDILDKIATDTYKQGVRTAFESMKATSVGKYVYFACPKLERGTKATDYTPAPEDVNQQITAAETIASQTADKFEWIVKGGDSSSNFTLTDRVADLVADRINFNGLVKFSGLNTDLQNTINNKTNVSYLSLSSGGNNQACWKIATIKISGNYINQDIIIGVNHRDHGYTECRIQFKNAGNPDPGLASFRQTGRPSKCWRIIKTANSTWELYLYKTDSWDGGNVVKYINPYHTTDNVSVTWSGENADLPSGTTTTEQMIADQTTIDGGIITTGYISADRIAADSITADKIATDAIKSRNYIYSGGTQGSFLNLGDGSFTSPNLSWDSNGNLIAKNANLSGQITATKGSIGKYEITDQWLITGSGSTATGIGGNQAFWAGAEDSNSAPFRVGYDGKFVSSNADISGKITATEGKIGKYEITDTYLKTGSGSTCSGIGSDDCAFWAGGTNSKDSNFVVLYGGSVLVNNLECNDRNSNDALAITNGTLYIQSDNNSAFLSSTGFEFEWGGDYRILSVGDGVKCYRNLYATDFIADGWIYNAPGGHYTWKDRNDAYISCGNYNNTNNVYYYAGYHAFYVNGDSGSGMMYIETSGVSSRKGFRNSSDERIKKDFRHFDDDFINSYMQLEPIKYRFKDDTDNSYHIGFKAQNVNSVLNDYGKSHNEQFGICATHHIDPEYAEKTYGENNMTEVYTLAYDELIGANTFMIQKTRKDLMYQAGRIDMQEAIINDLQTRLLQAEKTIKQLTQALA